jgi:hypothetical protein
MRLVLDSQQPRIILTVANDIQNGGHLVFTAQDNNFHMGIETPGNAAAEESRQLRSPSKHPGWFQGMGRVSFIRIQPRKPAVQIGAALDAGRKQAEYVDPVAKIRHKFTTATQIYVWSKWETSSGYAVVENVHSWMRVLQFMVNSNPAKDSGEPHNDSLHFEGRFVSLRGQSKPYIGLFCQIRHHKVLLRSVAHHFDSSL